VGLITSVAMLAFVSSSLEVAGAAVLTALGAAAVVGAASLGVLTRRSPDAALPRRATAAAAAGAALGFSPLVVNLASWDSALLEGWGAPFYLEVLLAGMAAVLALLMAIRFPRARLHAAGALIGIGALLALHLVGVLVEIGYGDGFRELRFGGALGIAGGLVLAAAGVGVLRAGRPIEAPASSSVPVA
ncbi:MAG: hypothetical protein M3168_00660, partial [Actinomycetota bacterium]|nr:hypothetical protein [Actinomycetota bacterium]